MRVCARQSLHELMSPPRVAIPLRLFPPLSLVGRYNSNKRMSFVLHVAAVRPVTATEVEAETPVEENKKNNQKRRNGRQNRRNGRRKEDWKTE